MPIVIDGYVTVRTDTLREHRGHDIVIANTSDRPARLAIQCDACGVRLATEPESRPEPLPCGCRDAAEHTEGVRLQEKLRRGSPRIPRSTCIGCYMGDDGPSIHSCVIHDRRYWA